MVVRLLIGLGTKAGHEVSRIMRPERHSFPRTSNRAYYHRCMTFRLPTLSCFARCLCALVTLTVIYADFEAVGCACKTGDKCSQITRNL